MTPDTQYKGKKQSARSESNFLGILPPFQPVIVGNALKNSLRKIIISLEICLNRTLVESAYLERFFSISIFRGDSLSRSHFYTH